MRKIIMFLPILPLIALMGCTATFRGIAEDFENLGKGMKGTASDSEGESNPSPSRGSLSSQSGAARTAQHNVDMRRAQERLKSAGFDPGPADGVFGSKTRAALRQYQTAQGLPATGTLDEPTRKALGVSSSQ